MDHGALLLAALLPRLSYATMARASVATGLRANFSALTKCYRVRCIHEGGEGEVHARCKTLAHFLNEALARAPLQQASQGDA
jgi:hypothetical protein